MIIATKRVFTVVSLYHENILHSPLTTVQNLFSIRKNGGRGSVYIHFFKINISICSAAQCSRYARPCLHTINAHKQQVLFTEHRQNALCTHPTAVIVGNTQTSVTKQLAVNEYQHTNATKPCAYIFVPVCPIPDSGTMGQWDSLGQFGTTFRQKKSPFDREG